MKIVVFSDSHGRTDPLVEVVEKERPSMILHLGDRVADAGRLAQLFPEIPQSAVAGNCDFGANAPKTKLIEAGGIKIFLCHGHTYFVDIGTDDLLRAAREREARVALFGHTHKGFCEKREGVWLLNPGSLTQPRGTPPSYGVIVTNEGGVFCKVIAHL